MTGGGGGRRPGPATSPAVSAGAPNCPFCGSDETELMSLFGSSPLTSQYYCRGCRTAFEQVKWGTPPPPAARPAKDS
jgi:transposase-like protein